jgi:acetyl esterase/lipase
MRGAGEPKRSSRHLVDPELLPVLEALPLFDLSMESLPAMRATRASIGAGEMTFSGLHFERRTVQSPDGAQVRVNLFRPEGAARVGPAILHIHGGGYVLGTADMTNATNAATALKLDCVIVSVDYRLAPETPFPGPLHDCYAALRWLHACAPELGVDPKRIAIAGESAGAGIAAGLALLARDRGDAPICFQCLVYPMLDDRTTAENTSPYSGEFVWNAKSNHFGWSAYLGRAPGAADIPSYAAPARATDLAGLPPAFINCGALDLFADEDIAYARRLMHAGVATELHIYPGAFHGFPLAPGTHLAAVAERDRIDALRRAFEEIQ